MAMSNRLPESSRSMPVKIGHLVDPRTMWAYPLYEGGEEHKRILKIEKQLSTFPTKPLTELSKTGMLVAARKSSDSDIWLRGRLDQISMYGKQLMATVFLIDYGEIIENLRVEKCVKHLPPGTYEEPPLAFKIILAGLSPVSMDLDFMLGQHVMEVTPQRGWDQAAWREVEQQIHDVEGIAEMKNWVRDQSGRYHGQIFLVGEDRKESVHLNQLLVEKQFAVESQWQMENDLDEETVDWENNKEFKALNIRDSELEHWEVYGDEIGDERASEEFGRVAFGVSEAIDESSGSSVFDSLGNVKSVGRGKPCKQEEEIVTEDRIGQREKKARDFLERLKHKNRRAGVDRKAEEIFEDGDPDFWNVVRPGKSHTVSDSSASHLLPGGVFIGKHHEKVLAHLQAENKQDQKKKFEQFVGRRKDNY